MSATGKPHDLHTFMEQITDEMASEYKRIYARATEDPGTAGDQGEENWAGLLREWLPSGYTVVTKGSLISYDNVTSPQIDVVVLKPSYPRKLFDKKLYLAAGVAAAFECKTTLTAAHIDSVMTNAAAIKTMYPDRQGSPYRELRSPLIYGLLAHSHSWKGAKSKPIENIQRALMASDIGAVTHPRLGLDLLCVADLGVWSAFTIAFNDPAWQPPVG